VDASISVGGWWGFIDRGPAFLLTRFDLAGELIPDFGLGGVAEASFGRRSRLLTTWPFNRGMARWFSPDEPATARIRPIDLGVARFNPDGTLDAAP
jgi:hypothetical protein